MDCKAPGLLETPSESEVTHCTISALDNISIQEEESSSALDLSKVSNKLEEMKQRVLYMKRLLIRPVQVNEAECPSESDHMKLDIEQSSSDNGQLSGVGQDTVRALEQINDLNRRLKESSDSLTELDAIVQRNIRCIRKLDKKLLEVPKWQEELKHNTGLCLERYNDLDISRGNYLDYSDNFVRPIQTNMKFCFASKAPLTCNRQDYNVMVHALSKSRRTLLKCHEDLMKYTRNLDEALTVRNFDNLVLPSISELSLLLEKSVQVNKRRNSSIKERRSFKFAWAAPLTKQEKYSPSADNFD
ncbi:uncharacterized protein LOC6546501 [Drosophila erecta]|uniref:Uncharacterized protein n=1 Tax=Drosophila erecta TaxID=7220 RepID=B3NGQ7_DROER|nr:uncharacterized protein LOC6546501 [Drosophila erecta]EDV51293.2 uncharacterized protein Dere_GG15430 [Drosophila erecta]